MAEETVTFDEACKLVDQWGEYCLRFGAAINHGEVETRPDGLFDRAEVERWIERHFASDAEM